MSKWAEDAKGYLTKITPDTFSKPGDTLKACVEGSGKLLGDPNTLEMLKKIYITS